MNIRTSLSADHLPPISSSPEESKPPRSASAPARMNGSDASFKLTEPKTHIKIPTPFALAQEEKAYSNYQAALTEQKTEQPSLWSSLFGSKAQKDVKKSLAVLSQLNHEDFRLDQAIQESKREFRAAVVAAGGNPDIAEEVFKSALEIPILPPSSSSPHGKATSSSKAPYASEGETVTEPNNDDPWHDVDSVNDDDDDLNPSLPAEPNNDDPWYDVDSVNDDDANPSLPEKDTGSIEGSSEKKPHSGSLEEFIASIHNLSREEIISFIESLSEPEVRNFAAANMEADLVSEFDTTSLREQLIDLFCSMSREAQAGISLDSPEAQQAITASFLEQPAPIQNQGLRNSGVDCYLSSALQCLRNHVANLPSEKQEELLTSLRTKYLENLSPEQGNSPLSAFGSPLAAFLEKKFDGRNAFAAAFLRKEVHNIMERLSELPVNPSAAATEIADSINPITGNSRQQCDTSEALVALMEHLETPRIMLNERDTYRVTGQVRPSDNQQARQHGGELIIPFGIEKTSSLQEIIHSNWVANLSGPNALEDPDGSKHDIHRERALEHFK